MRAPRGTGWQLARARQGALFLVALVLVVLGLDRAFELVASTGLSRWSAHYAIAALGALSVAIMPLLRRGVMRILGAFTASADVAQIRFSSEVPPESVTGLPGRHQLADLLGDAQLAGQPDDILSVLVINLDRFKLVNDIFGHQAGDQVLLTAADRLRSIAAASGAGVVHLGGDEFACFLSHHRAANASTALADQILESIAAPIIVDDRIVEVGVSIGIANGDGGAANDLLRTAGVAMSHAKRGGGASCRVFEPTMDIDLRNRAELESDLRAGIARGEVIPFYQPIFSFRAGDLVGFESLARWQHPSRGMLDPGIFIPIAEDVDAINDLCFSLLRQACRDVRNWPPHLTLSINISPIQFDDPNLPLRLLQILYVGGIAPGRLIVEITESALVRDVDAAHTTITSLRNAGVKVALDDFGTGYSSLHHLRELQFDRIKIDRSFIKTLDGFAGSKIVQAIIDLGHNLGMPVTAEGVESLEQADTLSRLGCTYGQGFLFGHPMPSQAALRLTIEIEGNRTAQRATV